MDLLPMYLLLGSQRPHIYTQMYLEKAPRYTPDMQGIPHPCCPAWLFLTPDESRVILLGSMKFWESPTVYVAVGSASRPAPQPDIGLPFLPDPTRGECESVDPRRYDYMGQCVCPCVLPPMDGMQAELPIDLPIQLFSGDVTVPEGDWDCEVDSSIFQGLPVAPGSTTSWEKLAEQARQNRVIPPPIPIEAAAYQWLKYDWEAISRRALEAWSDLTFETGDYGQCFQCKGFWVKTDHPYSRRLRWEEIPILPASISIECSACHGITYCRENSCIVQYSGEGHP